MRSIPTQNLHLCTLRPVLEVHNDDYSRHYASEEKYAFAFKVDGEFIDALSGDVYLKHDNSKLCDNDWCVEEWAPIITKYEYVSYAILLQSLNELNAGIFEHNDEKVPVKQRLLDFETIFQ